MVATSRKSANLIVDADGVCKPMGTPPAKLRTFPQRNPYRLYRFLSDLDDLVESVKDERTRLQIGAELVRRLLARASWIGDTLPMPDKDKGWAVHTLYKEPDYPFTIQTVSWLPGIPSPVHNHATWSLVAIMGDESAGRERNRLWKRVDDRSRSGHAELELVEERLLYPGDIIGFTPEAIHSVEQEAAEGSWLPTFTFNVYGLTDYPNRFEYDPANKTVKNF